MKSSAMTRFTNLPNYLAALCLLFSVVAAAADAPKKNGEFIDCKNDAGGKPEVACRFMLAGSPSIIELSVDFAGKTLATSNFAEYPAQGETTALLMLVDVSDPKRAKAVAAAADLIRQVMAKKQPHQDIAIAQFDGAMQLLVDFHADDKARTAAINSITSKGYATELYKNAIDAIGLLKKNSATRKGLIIFSDGKAEDRGYKHEDVINEAANAGVMIFTVGYAESASDTPYLQTLERLAKESGGLYAQSSIADKAAPVGTVERMLSYTENGGRIMIPVGEKFGTQEIKIAMKLEDNSTVDLVTTIDLPDQRAASKKFADDVRNNKFTVAGIVLLIIVLIAAAIWYRMRKKSQVEPVTTFALLEELSGQGAAFPLQKRANRIGRAADNDVCLANSTVSSYHAEIHIRRDGEIVISDLGSSNGTYVNDKKINQQAIEFGTVIEIGEVRLRLRRADDASAPR